MDSEIVESIKKVLTAVEIEAIPPDIFAKIEKNYEQCFEELITNRALSQSSRSTIEQVREEYEEKLRLLGQNLESESNKCELAEQSIAELRQQIADSNSELSKLRDTVKKTEGTNNDYRQQRNEAVDERNSLLKVVERSRIEIERLRLEYQTTQDQLHVAITAKCEAIAKLDEIQCSEMKIKFKEKHMNQEKEWLENQIKCLNEDLNKNMNEIQAMRRETSIKTLTIENRLTEKTEELKIANETIAHLKENNAALVVKSEELAVKLASHGEDSCKMMEFYKNELQSQSNLCELYKDAADDNSKQIKELGDAVNELKKMLTEASDEYGILETKLKATNVQHDENIETLNKTIQSLKEELAHANELLKSANNENLDNAVANFSAAAGASRSIIKSGSSLTEVYSQYVREKEELLQTKKENAKLTLQMQTILQEVEEKAPIFHKLNLNYQNLVQANQDLEAQLSELIDSKTSLNSEVAENRSKLEYQKRENKKLKIERADLSRQVCNLLNIIEQNRCDMAPPQTSQSISSDSSANEVITKKLITFNDIQELQENNLKLVFVVRDLSEKLEQIEECKIGVTKVEFSKQLEKYVQQIQGMQKTLDQETQMLNACMQQRDRYKKMYYELRNNSGFKMSSTHHLSGTRDDNINMMIDDDEEIKQQTSSANSFVTNNESNASVIEDLKGKLKDVEDQLAGMTKKYNTIEAEYDVYRKERKTNEKMANDQLDQMRSELRDLTISYTKIVTTLDSTNEQIKIQQKNSATYKKQIAILEQRNKAYECSIVKHENATMLLKDEVISANNKLARTEVLYENMKSELLLTKSHASRLEAERDMYLRERQSHSLMLNHLELIKNSIEKNDSDSKQKMDDRLDDAIRECSALRRRLLEEQDNFKDLTQHMERQKSTIEKRMNEEIELCNKMRLELQEVQNDLEKKNAKIDELNNKIQEILSPSTNSNPIAEANKRARDMELKYNETVIEFDSIRIELATAKEHTKQYFNMSTEYENELKELNETYVNYKTTIEAELAAVKQSETNLKSKIDEMETEISIRETSAQLSTGDVNTQLYKAQSELKDALIKLSANNSELSDLRARCTNIENSLRIVEKKYANEMMQRSNDIQALTNVKDELFKYQSKYESLEAERNNAISALETNSAKWAELQQQMLNEREEYEQRIKDLNAQNEVMHDQIQSINSIPKTYTDEGESNSQLNESVDAANSSLLNKSVNENDTSEKLLQVIRFLRKEKDIAFAKVDIFRSENVRLQAEMGMLKTKVAELTDEVKQERVKSDFGSISFSKHNEILRKVETLNAITDSNRTLREERDKLSSKVNELTERLTKVEDELYPLQDKNRDLSGKIETFTTENGALRIEASKWRQRANLLVERSNKTNPEDWKRLQNERENLVRMLTTEKDNLKKLNEELIIYKTEKTQLETDITNHTKHVETLTEEVKKLNQDLETLRSENSSKFQEMDEIKLTITNRNNDIKKLNKVLIDKDAMLVDAKNKEIQIRKIAKRYKDSYYELKAQVEQKDKIEKGSDQSGSGTKETKTEKEKFLELQLIEIKIELITCQNELEQFRKNSKENSDGSQPDVQNLEKEVVRLQMEINTLNDELANERAQHNQTREEYEATKSELDSNITRLEKEVCELDSQNKEALTRLNRENEYMMARMTQLHRQMGQQQATKPSTSAGLVDKSTIESPPTANVKPMAGSSSGQQSTAVQPRRGNETPLASIRPMSVQGSRTAAVLPTSQTSNLAAVQGSSSSSSSSTSSSSSSSSSQTTLSSSIIQSGSITALVPPQQQVHTTGGSSNNSGESMSSSPTSSHTDYMPATSSAAVVVATVTPMGSASNVAESSQQEHEITNQNNESSSSQIILPGGSQQQQTVALVVPRVESSPPAMQQQQPLQQQVPIQKQQTQSQQMDQNTERNQAPSTSGTSSSSSANQQPIALVSHHQASSSSTVTTTQAAHKNKRDSENETDLKSDTPTQQIKRRRVDAFQGVSESGLDVEYQVPTSSQRDQEDDIIIVDSDEEDEDEDDDDEEDGMVDEGNADVDDGPFEDEADIAYEIEESYEQEQEIVNYDDGEGPDIDEDNVQSANNEVEVDDEIEVPNQSGTSTTNNENQGTPDAGTSSNQVGQSGSAVPSSNTIDPNVVESFTTQHSVEIQQIQSISSGSDAPGPSSALQSPSQWRQNTPIRQTSSLTIEQHRYDDNADDRKVPCTPTLYAGRRIDSPNSQNPHGSRFMFNDSPRSILTLSGSELDESIELSQIDFTSSRSVPTGPQPQPVTSDERIEEIQESSSTTQNEVNTAFSGHSESQVPEICITQAADDSYITDSNEENASTSNAPAGDKNTTTDATDNNDGVTSEGEKSSQDLSQELEESSEAEVLGAPSSNTRSRGAGANRSMRNRGGRTRHANNSRSNPTNWARQQRPESRSSPMNPSDRGNMPNRNMFLQQQQQQHHHQQQQQQQQQQQGLPQHHQGQGMRGSQRPRRRNSFNGMRY